MGQSQTHTFCLATGYHSLCRMVPPKILFQIRGLLPLARPPDGRRREYKAALSSTSLGFRPELDPHLLDGLSANALQRVQCRDIFVCFPIL